MVRGTADAISWAAERERLTGLFRNVQSIPAFGDCSDVEVSGPIHLSSHSRLFVGRQSGKIEKFLIKCCYITDTDVADVDRARAQYDALLQVNAAHAPRARFNIARPLHLFEQQGIIIQSWVDGRSLDRLLADRSIPVQRLKELFRAAGEWLGDFHRCGGIGRQAWNNQGLVGEIKDSAKSLGRRGERFLRTIEKARLAETMGIEWTQIIAPLHCDFKPANVIANDSGGLSVVDFQSSKRASIYFDIAHLLNSAVLDAIGASRLSLLVNAKALHREFVEGYERAAGPIDPLVLALYLVYDAIRYVCHQSDVLTVGAKGFVKSWVIARLFYSRLAGFKSLRRRRLLGAH